MRIPTWYVKLQPVHFYYIGTFDNIYKAKHYGVQLQIWMRALYHMEVTFKTRILFLSGL